MKEYKYVCEDDDTLLATDNEAEFRRMLEDHLREHDMTGVKLNEAAEQVLAKVKEEMKMAG
ncbi:MAG: hypothetical protein HOV79_31000 [Hamadaea sp.]|nr:hypothetical protein [Hamadaea sp.]